MMGSRGPGSIDVVADPWRSLSLVEVMAEAIRHSTTRVAMRMTVLLAITLFSGTVGFFAGGYLFNRSHPVPASPPPVVPTGPGFGSQFRALQALELQGAKIMERHMERHKWLICGAVSGGGIGFVGTVLASRVVRRRCPP
jgi:hypothetical protein